MAIRVMTEVWLHSIHAGPRLLLMLAIADFADDEGVAFPSVNTLATKTRVTPREVRHLLRQLRDSGELVVEHGAGPHGTNLFRLKPVAGLKPVTVRQVVSALQSVSGEGACHAPMQPVAEGDATQRTSPLQAIAAKPSITVSEPPKEEPSLAPARVRSIGRTRRDRRRSALFLENFEAFWAAYPKRVSKLNAERAWDRIRPDAELLKTILTAIELQKGRWQDSQFIPYPATWLNQHRWQDELPRVDVKKGNSHGTYQGSLPNAGGQTQAGTTRSGYAKYTPKQ